MLEDLGLLPAIDHLIDDFSARYGIRVIRHIDQDAVNFNRQCRNGLFRIVQEGKATATPAKPRGERAQTTLSATLRRRDYSILNERSFRAAITAIACAASSAPALLFVREPVRERQMQLEQFRARIGGPHA
jgi:hypothetical protein